MARLNPNTGIIALDIDGTITSHHHQLPKRVSAYLNELLDKGWQLLFVTGRTFSFGSPVLSSLKKPYFFAPQNGSALYQMPEGKWIKHNYIPIKDIEKIEEVLEEMGTGALVESGKEYGDLCFFNPSDFSEEELAYIRFRQEISAETWKEVTHFKEIGIPEFAMVKFRATKERAEQALMRFQKVGESRLKAIKIRDPFTDDHYFVLVTGPHASKGEAIRALKERYPGKVIGAGNDFNDIDLLEASDIKIVMKNAPEEMHPLADIIAPHVDEEGIIDALKQAL